MVEKLRSRAAARSNRLGEVGVSLRSLDRSETTSLYPQTWTDLIDAEGGFPLLATRLLSLRAPIGITAIVVGSVVGVSKAWPAALAVAVLGVVLCIDAWMRKRGMLTSVAGALILDTTLVGLAILVLRAPPAVISMPFAYVIATSFLVVHPRKAAVPVGYAVAWMSFLLIGNRFLWQPAEGLDGLIVSITMGAAFVGSMVVMFGSTGRVLGDVRESLDRKIRFEKAIAESSRAFATGDEDTAIDVALQALLNATGATAVFVERNVEHPTFGLCSSLLHEVLDDGVAADPDDTWTMVPWSEMPLSYASLSVGQPVDFDVADLPDIEKARYDGSGVLSELDIPIMLRGEWVGLIGFNDVRISRVWDDREIELLSTAAELIAAHWERIEARERLEELITAKDDFIASISHEIRTPLTAVMGFTDVLREDHDALESGDTAEILKLISGEAQEVAWIVEDLLVYGRSDIGTLAAKSIDVCLEEQVRSIVAVQSNDMLSHVKVSMTGERASADPARTRQIVRNLLINAVRYGGPNIEVRAASLGETVELAVIDDGCGIDDSKTDLVFTAYFKGQESDSMPSSIGLGLHVSRKLAQLMGGDLRYERIDNHSHFTLTLPAASPALVGASHSNATNTE